MESGNLRMAKNQNRKLEPVVRCDGAESLGKLVDRADVLAFVDFAPVYLRIIWTPSLVLHRTFTTRMDMFYVILS